MGVPTMEIIGVRLPEGRVGSTLLMQLLSTAPEIVFDRRYPSEYRFASYFSRMAASMTEPFDESRHPGVTPFFFGSPEPWGPVPFRSDIVDVPALRAPLLRSMWAAWTTVARAAHPHARFYAEKLAVPIEPLIEAGLDVRVIDLVRDPRDMLASIRAFVAHGVDGFGWRPGLRDEQYVEQLIVRLRARLALVTAPTSVDRVVVRYEDLARDLHAAARRLEAWLGVRLDADAVVARTPEYAHHMTSATVDGSIGRWRRDLPAEEAARLWRELADLLVPLGYLPT